MAITALPFTITFYIIMSSGSKVYGTTKQLCFNGLNISRTEFVLIIIYNIEALFTEINLSPCPYSSILKTTVYKVDFSVAYF